jgi:hypothetical protein
LIGLRARRLIGAVSGGLGCEPGVDFASPAAVEWTVSPAMDYASPAVRAVGSPAVDFVSPVVDWVQSGG